MTGTARGPERGSPEYRTAEQQKDSKTPRQAIKSLHAAEAALLAAQRQDAMARALADIALQAELTGASRRRALSSHYAAKVMSLAPSLTKEERHAAIMRLQGEEAAAALALDLDLRQEAAAARSQTLMHLRQHYRSQSIGLRQRQRRQRAALALLFRRSGPRAHRIMPLPAIRKLAARIHLRRTSRIPPRGPR